MAHVRADEVRSPKQHWQLIEVLLDRGERDCAYALGEWDGERRIGFRWNGSDENPIGNPQSRGLPTYTMLDRALHEAVIALLPDDKKAFVRRFLGTGVLFDSVTVSDDRRRIILWDLRHTPPVLATVDCAVLRDLIKNPMISDDDCRLLADRNKDVVSQVAQAMLAQHQFKTRDNGVRVIELQLADLSHVATEISTGVLEIARRSRWSC